MTAEQLDEIQKSLDAATPGPWEAKEKEVHTAKEDIEGYKTQVCKFTPSRIAASNIHLIAHAPTWLRSLLAEVQRLTADRDRQYSLKVETYRKNAEWQEQHERLTAEVQRQQGEIQRLSAERTEMREEYVRYRSNLRAEKDRLQAENDQLRQEIDRYAERAEECLNSGDYTDSKGAKAALQDIRRAARSILKGDRTDG